MNTATDTNIEITNAFNGQNINFIDFHYFTFTFFFFFFFCRMISQKLNK